MMPNARQDPQTTCQLLFSPPGIEAEDSESQNMPGACCQLQTCPPTLEAEAQAPLVLRVQPHGSHPASGEACLRHKAWDPLQRLPEGGRLHLSMLQAQCRLQGIGCHLQQAVQHLPEAGTPQQCHAAVSRAGCQGVLISCSPVYSGRPASVSLRSVQWGTAGLRSQCSSFAVRLTCSGLDGHQLASLSGTSAGCSPDKTHCLQRPQLSIGRRAHPRGQSAGTHQVNTCTDCGTRCTPRAPRHLGTSYLSIAHCPNNCKAICADLNSIDSGSPWGYHKAR